MNVRLLADLVPSTAPPARGLRERSKLPSPHSGAPPASMRHIDTYIDKGEQTETLFSFLRELVERL
jgi:hypothetical protein